MATRRSEWLASIKPILDRDEAKKDAAALAKELGDILEVKVGASPENLDELAKEFNAQLKTMGKQPIVFSEKTIKGIVSQFSMAITAGMKDGIDKSKLMLKDLASLQEAYVRHQNASWKKTGKRVRSGFVNSAKGAFEYEPSDTAIKIGNNLRAITNEFNQATNWEEQYVALLKYIKAYEKLESITSDPKSLEKWAMIGDYAIQDLKDARPGIEHSLQNIFQVAYGKAVDGLTDVGDIDVDVKLTPIKMIDAYDITGGKGHIEVEVKPVVKKAKKNETPNAFRGVHKPSGGEGRSISRSLLGGDFWTDNDGKSLFLSSYGEESGEADAKNLTAVFKSLNRLVVDAEEGGRGDAKAFNEIDQLKFLQHLFPGIENFINTADPDSRDYVQKYYNEMARQAGFDLFEVTNVNEGADELATTLVPLQDRIIEWASKIPEYYDVEKFTPEMERDIISRQKGSSERWYAQTIERLESQMAQAVTNEDINEVNYLQGLIPKIKEMYSSAMSNFDTAIAQYGGYIEESVLQGLPEVISANADGKLVPKFSADDLKTKIQEFVRLSKELDQIRDSEPNKKDYASTEEYNEAKDLYDNLEDTYQQKIDILYNQLINGLPNNLQNEIDNLLIDAVDGAASFDDVFNKLQPHLSYNENAVNGAPSTVKHQTKTDKQDGTEKADETKIARTKELVAQMDVLNNSEDESVESVRQKLAKLESILSLIKSEGLITDEILQKSSLIERSLDDRYRKLQSVELEAENTNPISHQNEHEHKSSDITEKYEKASESVKNLVNSLITLDQQMQTLDERTAATNMDGFDKWNPSDEHKNTIVNTLNEYQRVMQQISGFSIETDDDKKKLIELKEEALQLANTLKMAYRSDSNPDSYMKDYRVSRDQAGVFMDINNESSKLRNEIRTALNSEFSSVFQQIQDEDSGFARALLDDANGLSGLADKIMADTNAHKQNTAAIEEEARAQEQLKNTQVQTTDTDYDAETIAKENGALEDKLELLQEIAEQYGNNISQKQRDRYEELNQKDMNEGLTPKEDERYWELGEQIEEADSALEEFGQTYDKIIVKLENGKNVEILPDDKGLRTLAKIDEEYGESYNGIEIEDVIYERIQKEAVAAEQAVDALNDSVEETRKNIQKKGVYAFSASQYDKYADYLSETPDDKFVQEQYEKHKNELLDFMGNDPDSVEQALKLWKQQIESRMATINEAVKRVSKMSAIPKELTTSGTGALYQEAAKVGQQLSTMYDDGITDTEEYIALQHKLLKLFDTIANAYGGVKGSGAKDRYELDTWMYRNLKEDTGFDIHSGNTIDALYEGANPVYDEKGKKRSMRDQLADLLEYKSEVFSGSTGFEIDTTDLKEVEELLRVIEKRKEELFAKPMVAVGTGDASSAELEAAVTKTETLQDEVEQKNKELVNKDAEIARIQAESEAEKRALDDAKATLQNDLDVANRQNAELRERASNDGDAIFTAEQRANEAEERAAMYDRAMTSMQEEMADLRGKLAGAKTGGESSSASLEELKNVLNSIVYNVKIAHDDNDKTANKIALDGSTLETTLTKVFANILNPQTQQNDSEQTEKRWALESTLQTVKSVLDNIHTNTTNIGTIKTSDIGTITDSTLDGRLVEIKSVLESIENKIVDGGKIINRDGAKQIYKDTQKDTGSTQTARSNMMKSLINDYKTMGKLAAQFANDGDLETKAKLDNLKEEIARKRKSLKLTMDENASLREKYSVAFDAEKRLLDAEKAQKEINAQIKADAKEAETAWKKQVKDAQRATGINAATSAANAGDQTVLRAIGTEGVSKDIENKAKELSDNIKTLRALRDEIDKKGEQASDADRDKLSKQISKVKELKTEIDGYLKIHEKYSGEGATQFNDVDTSNFGAVGTDQYWNNITAAIKNASTGRVTIKGMNTDTGELTGTTKIAANTFAQWSATVDPITGKLSMLRTGIKKTETIIEQITRKTKEIFTYFSGSSIIFKVFNELKKGVQYVRDIDLALTELKKVTDETEETYRKFLDTASKTAAKVGSTIKDVVSSTADWARLNI